MGNVNGYRLNDMGASAVFYAMLINCISEKNACFLCYRENLSAVLLETVLFCCVLMFFLVCFWLLLYAFNVHPFSPPTNFFFLLNAHVVCALQHHYLSYSLHRFLWTEEASVI